MSELVFHGILVEGAGAVERLLSDDVQALLRGIEMSASEGVGVCNARTPYGYGCSLEPGHESIHIAGGFTHNVHAIWND